MRVLSISRGYLLVAYVLHSCRSCRPFIHLHIFHSCTTFSSSASWIRTTLSSSSRRSRVRSSLYWLCSWRSRIGSPLWPPGRWRRWRRRRWGRVFLDVWPSVASTCATEKGQDQSSYKDDCDNDRNHYILMNHGTLAMGSVLIALDIVNIVGR